MALRCWMGMLLLTTCAEGSKHELELIKMLTAEKTLRDVLPSVTSSSSVTVQLGITLSQVVILDAKNQILTTSVWIRQKWHNPHLQWNASEYGGLTSINLSPDRVWLPDITLYNNAEGNNAFGGSMDKLSNRVILHHSGTNTWLSPAVINSKCNVDITYFPFDTQRCEIKFGSWTYDGFRLDLQVESSIADLSKYTPNAEWQLVNMTATRNVVKYTCCHEPYPDITYTVIIKRRSLFYIINMIMPLVLISSLACLTFLVPPEAGERIALTMTILLSMTVFMLVVNNMIPPTSDVVPLIAKFYTATMIETTAVLFLACYTLSLHHRDPTFHRMPRWMRHHVLGWMARLFGVRNKGRQDGKTSKPVSPQPKHDDVLQQLLEQIMDSGKDGDQVRYDDIKLLPTFIAYDAQERTRSVLPRQPAPSNSFQGSDCARNGSVTIKSRGQSRRSCNRRTHQLHDRVTAFSESRERGDAHWQEKRQKWKQVAMILDKAALLGFLIVFLATLAGVFVSAPGYVS